MQIIIIQICIYHFVPKVEKYSQNASIEFYKYAASKNIKVDAANYMSYSQYFYGNRQINYSSDKEYFVGKTKDNKIILEQNPTLHIIKSKNGFTLFSNFLKK